MAAENAAAAPAPAPAPTAEDAEDATAPSPGWVWRGVTWSGPPDWDALVAALPRGDDDAKAWELVTCPEKGLSDAEWAARVASTPYGGATYWEDFRRAVASGHFRGVFDITEVCPRSWFNADDVCKAATVRPRILWLLIYRLYQRGFTLSARLVRRVVEVQSPSCKPLRAPRKKLLREP